MTRSGERFPELLRIALVNFSLALILCFVSNNLERRFENRELVVEQQFALLAGRPYLVDGQIDDWPPFRSRVLFPLVLSAASQWTIVPPAAWFIILRIVSAFLALMVFTLLLRRVSGTSIKGALLGSGWLALGMIPTFNHSWEHPTDFPDVLFFATAIWFAMRRWPLALLVATVLGSLNHQTAAFAGIIWFCLYGWDGRWKLQPRQLAFGAALIAASRATTWMAEWSIRGQAQWGHVINGYQTIDQFLHFLRHPYASGWPVLLFAMVTPTVIWIAVNRRVLTGTDRRLLAAVALTIAISSIIAFMAELRSVFLAPHVLAVFVAASAESRADR